MTVHEAWTPGMKQRVRVAVSPECRWGGHHWKESPFESEYGTVIGEAIAMFRETFGERREGSSIRPIDGHRFLVKGVTYPDGTMEVGWFAAAELSPVGEGEADGGARER